MHTPPDHDPSDDAPEDGSDESPLPFSWEELADWRAGMLTAAEEERLRMRMDDDPETARRMLADLDAVEAEFPDPPHAHEPLDVPAHVAARWQSAISREAERRALGYPPDPPADPDDTSEPGPHQARTEHDSERGDHNR